MNEEEKAEAEERWLKVADAYEILTDEKKKKKYDSTLNFDDSIPKEEDINPEKSEK